MVELSTLPLLQLELVLKEVLEIGLPLLKLLLEVVILEVLELALLLLLVLKMVLPGLLALDFRCSICLNCCFLRCFSSQCHCYFYLKWCSLKYLSSNTQCCCLCLSECSHRCSSLNLRCWIHLLRCFRDYLL
jgi:hypothetical protein